METMTDTAANALLMFGFGGLAVLVHVLAGAFLSQRNGENDD